MSRCVSLSSNWKWFPTSLSNAGGWVTPKCRLMLSLSSVNCSSYKQGVSLSLSLSLECRRKISVSWKTSGIALSAQLSLAFPPDSLCKRYEISTRFSLLIDFSLSLKLYV